MKWKMTSSGDIDIKSAYKVAVLQKTLNEDSLGDCSDHHNLSKLWQAVWKMPVPNKIKIFIWRLYYRAIPTGEQLFKRNMCGSMSCPICYCEMETDSHPFIQCWWAKYMWDSMDFRRIMAGREQGTMADLLFVASRSLKLDEFAKFCVCLWYIWFVRNKMKHEANLMSPIQATRRVKQLCKDFKARKTELLNNINLDCSEWGQPSNGFVKVSCDGSFDESTHQGGAAAVVRSREGIIDAVHLSYLQNCNDIYQCEVKALHSGMLLAKRLRLEKVIFEVDCVKVVQDISMRRQAFGMAATWLNEIEEALDRCKDWFVFYTRREEIDVADLYAKTARRRKIMWNNCDAVPFSAHVAELV